MPLYKRSLLQTYHTFSAYWLRSSVVSVLISVKTGIFSTEKFFFTSIFLGGGVPLELAPRPSRVALALHLAGSSTPFGGNTNWT